MVMRWPWRRRPPITRLADELERLVARIERGEEPRVSSQECGRARLAVGWLWCESAPAPYTALEQLCFDVQVLLDDEGREQLAAFVAAMQTERLGWPPSPEEAAALVQQRRAHLRLVDEEGPAAS
jgi:hypothetical protein